MLEIQYERSFKKDFKRMLKRGYNQEYLKDVLSLLVNQAVLPEKYKDHKLSGNYAAIVNAILNRIGFSFIKFMTIN